MREVLSRSYFAGPTVEVAPSLIGKYLVRENGHGQIAGKIVEVEAYVGRRTRLAMRRRVERNGPTSCSGHRE
jgi:3-methyladenine DNA glycosylase Mpg